jgi:Tol biopolymer transport system component
MEIDPKTGAMHRLAKGEANRPLRSPDENAIAFTRGAYEDRLWVMDAHGSNKRLLYQAPPNTPIQRFSWSPDSQQLVMDRNAGNFGSELWVVNADGSGERQVPHPATNPNSGRACPGWSPDGSEFVYSRVVDEDFNDSRDLFASSTEGTNERVIVGGTEEDVSPLWSPAGDEILFSRRYVSSEPNENLINDLFVEDSAGGEPRNITNSPDLIKQYFTWSPNGEKIAYVAYERPWGPGTPAQLWIMNADGTGAKLLYKHGQHAEPSWSQDSSRLVFADLDVFMVRADGSHLHVVKDLTRAGASVANWASPMSCNGV